MSSATFAMSSASSTASASSPSGAELAKTFASASSTANASSPSGAELAQTFASPESSRTDVAKTTEPRKTFASPESPRKMACGCELGAVSCVHDEDATTEVSTNPTTFSVAPGGAVHVREFSTRVVKAVVKRAVDDWIVSEEIDGLAARLGASCTVVVDGAECAMDDVLRRFGSLGVEGRELFVAGADGEERIGTEGELFRALARLAGEERVSFRTGRSGSYRSPAASRKRSRCEPSPEDGAAGKSFLNVSSSGLVIASPRVFDDLAAGRKVRAKIFDEDGVVHDGRQCTACDASPIVGARYEAADGAGDVCEPCLLSLRRAELANGRGPTRRFRRVPHPVRDVVV